MFRSRKAKMGSKMTMGTMAFAAPIFLGVVLTSGAGFDSGLLSGDTEDQWIISQDDDSAYTLDRTQIDGVVELIVTDENGNVVPVESYPDFVATAAAEFGAADWIPEELTLFQEVDGKACYDSALLAELTGEESVYGATSSSPEGTLALEAHADGEVDAAYFEGEVSDSVLQAQLESGGRYMDLDGAQELGTC